MRLLLPLCALLVASPAAAQTIVLDAGHGGSDPGAVGCSGLQEAPTVLDVAQRTQVLLEGVGLRVELTRSDDRFVGLSARASYANGLGADLFVSIHSNANGGTPASGTETFVANSASATSVAMGGHLQREMVDAWGLPDRGVKRANFTVIATTRMPAALTEIAFTNRCDPDAALLRSAAARADMAEAHARGVLLTLGRDPDSIGSGPPPPPPPTGTGVFRGVAFEDVGAGLEDTTRRLAGATVTVDGMSRTADPDTGHFRFDLAPGSHTVRASLAGYRDASRTCEVSSGGETWCSVGLMAGTTEPPPPPPPSSDDAGPAADAGEPSPDAGVQMPVMTEPPPGTPGTGRPGEAEGCSVSAGAGGRGGAPWLLTLMLAWVFLWRPARRRRGARLSVTLTLTLVIAVAVGASGCGEVEHTQAPLGERVEATSPAADPPPARDPVARAVARLATLHDVRPLAEGLTAPVLSADGRVAATNADLSQLWLLDGRVDAARSERGAPELVAEGARVGLHPVFADGALRYRHAQQSVTAVPHYAIALDPVAADPSRTAGDPRTPSAFVRLDDEQRVWLTLRGAPSVRISPEGDRFLEPSVSRDEAHVVFWGMTTGVFVYRIADGRRVSLGDGGHPRFDDTGRWIVFDRTEDDGHSLTAGDLYLADTATETVAPLTATPDTIEQMPSMAGGQLAFATPEGVLIARVTLD